MGALFTYIVSATVNVLNVSVATALNYGNTAMLASDMWTWCNITTPVQ